MATADEIASAGTYLSKNAGVEVTDGTQVRATLGIINSTTGADGAVNPIDYGLKVVSSDGVTVIIDGTSDIFKIAGTGTMTQAFPASPNVSANQVALPALGTFSLPPAYLALVTDGASATAFQRAIGDFLHFNSTPAVDWRAYFRTILDLSNNVNVILSAASYITNPGTTAQARYYILTEAGI